MATCSSIDQSSLVCLPATGKNNPVTTSKQIIHSQDATISTTVSSDGNVEVHSYIPDGIEVSHGEHGRCIRATKFWPKGAVLYRGYGALLNMEGSAPAQGSNASKQDDNSVELTESTVSSSASEDDKEYVLFLYKADGSLVHTQVLDDVHTVQDVVDPIGSVRQVYGFDAFTDHSCSPNTATPLLHRTNDKIVYDCYALEDINPGDMITCDYDAYEWECDGHQILQCGCGADNCRGQIIGFKNLPLKDKVRLMPDAEEEVIERFLEENPQVKVSESTLPDGVTVIKSDLPNEPAELSLVAARDFCQGEIVYTNRANKIAKADLAQNTYIEKVGKHYVLLDPNHHFVHRPDYVEHLGFDTFQDHSCDPNTCQEYQDAITYTVRAAKNIAKGEKLTIDYGSLENQAEHIEHIPSASFQCQCGSSKCRGMIYA